jgi:formamidopyrimidine-DNA glycosylase
MPELPDLVVYLDALQTHVVGRTLEDLQLLSPFVLRTVEPAVAAVRGRPVAGVRRVGKRLVLEFPDDLFVAIHLMIAGRLRWRAAEPAGAGRKAPPKVPAKLTLARFRFPNGTLHLTEAGTKKRAAIHILLGESGLRALDRGGVEPFDVSFAEFRDALTRGNHTVKRALSSPDLISGIGNAYSDEILHAAKLSPVKLTGAMTEDQHRRLFEAVQMTLRLWIERLRADAAGGFPEKVTAFREDMAVHGRFGKPCPVCGTRVQRIVHADNECNYCPTCQTEGRLLADRALSRLLRKDWPKRLDG